MDNSLSIFSYNSRDFNTTTQDTIQTLSISGSSLPIICNQENFLLKVNEYKIRQCLPDHHILLKFLNLLPNRILMVDQKMFIAVHSCLKEKVEYVSPLPPRIQIALIETQNCKIILINTYFPRDPISLMLSDIRNIMNKYESDRLIWTGDINADFKRSTRFCRNH